MNIDNILKLTQKVMCDNSLYSQREYFYIPHKKFAMSIIKELTNMSYEAIGKEFKKSWFAIYKDCKDVRDQHKTLFNKVLERVKKKYES